MSGIMLNKIMDCFNLWRYGDNDGNWEDEDGFFGSVTEGDFLLNIVTYKPQTMDDVQEICDRFLDGDAVILYFEQAEEKDKERIVDFLSGAIYSQNGNILKISNHIYAISPENVGLF
ncbi:cell division protein SepF [[Clostridium] symbiosum]|nr:hypothetical protein HMPREF9475_03070 [[Clostridium] symbiosum WAL-14673]MBO1695993.1 cell division protein SepF [[Clostridium] symbiosum]